MDPQMRYCDKCKSMYFDPHNCNMGKDVKIHPTAKINVENLWIGDRSVINAHARIEGKYVHIGREAWIHEYSWIGGGSCWEETSRLEAGDFLHLGKFAHLNTAAGLIIGDEVGIGHQSNVWTHGAYLPMDQGFPVQFQSVYLGNRVWLPHAWVNPGVHIQDDVVVSAMSLVNISLPKGCLAGGIPVKILRKHCYPIPYTKDDWSKLGVFISRLFKKKFTFDPDKIVFSVDGTDFFIKDRMISGWVTKDTERFKDILRKAGIRFRYCNNKKESFQIDVLGEYEPWI